MKFSRLLIPIFLLLTVSVAADETPKQSSSCTYEQKYCGYSITLPAGWQQVLDEKDLDIKTWGGTSGLYRYHPQPGKHPGHAEWIYVGDPGVYLMIHMIKREPGFGYGQYVDHFLHLYFEDGFKSVDKGSYKISDRQCKWWIMNAPEGGDVYLLLISNGEYFYCVTFTTTYVSSELKSKFDSIIQTMKFSN